MEINRLICSTMVQIRNANNEIAFVGEDIGEKLSINFPNGNLESEENYKDSAKRQFFEITGLNVREEDIEFVGIIETYGENEKKMLVLYKTKVNDNVCTNQTYGVNTKELFWESLPNIRHSKFKFEKYFNLALKLYTTKFTKCVYKVNAGKEEIMFFA